MTATFNEVLDGYRSLTSKGIPPNAAATMLLAMSVDYLGVKLGQLGNADAATPMGAIEAFGMLFKESMSELTAAIDHIGENP